MDLSNLKTLSLAALLECSKDAAAMIPSPTNGVREYRIAVRDEIRRLRRNTYRKMGAALPDIAQPEMRHDNDTILIDAIAADGRRGHYRIDADGGAYLRIGDSLIPATVPPTSWCVPGDARLPQGEALRSAFVAICAAGYGLPVNHPDWRADSECVDN